MNHEQALTHLASLALDELAGAERDSVQAHVDQCVECQQELRDMQAAFALLQDAVATLPDMPLTADRADAVLLPVATAAPTGAAQARTAPVAAPGVGKHRALSVSGGSGVRDLACDRETGARRVWSQLRRIAPRFRAVPPPRLLRAAALFVLTTGGLLIFLQSTMRSFLSAPNEMRAGEPLRFTDYFLAPQAPQAPQATGTYSRFDDGRTVRGDAAPAPDPEQPSEAAEESWELGAAIGGQTDSAVTGLRGGRRRPDSGRAVDVNGNGLVKTLEFTQSGSGRLSAQQARGAAGLQSALFDTDDDGLSDDLFGAPDTRAPAAGGVVATTGFGRTSGDRTVTALDSGVSFTATADTQGARTVEAWHAPVELNRATSTLDPFAASGGSRVTAAADLSADLPSITTTTASTTEAPRTVVDVAGNGVVDAFAVLARDADEKLGNLSFDGVAAGPATGEFAALAPTSGNASGQAMLGAIKLGDEAQVKMDMGVAMPGRVRRNVGEEHNGQAGGDDFGDFGDMGGDEGFGDEGGGAAAFDGGMGGGGAVDHGFGGGDFGAEGVAVEFNAVDGAALVPAQIVVAGKLVAGEAKGRKERLSLEDLSEKSAAAKGKKHVVMLTDGHAAMFGGGLVVTGDDSGLEGDPTGGEADGERSERLGVFFDTRPAEGGALPERRRANEALSRGEPADRLKVVTRSASKAEAAATRGRGLERITKSRKLALKEAQQTATEQLASGGLKWSGTVASEAAETKYKSSVKPKGESAKTASWRYGVAGIAGKDAAPAAPSRPRPAKKPAPRPVAELELAFDNSVVAPPVPEPAAEPPPPPVAVPMPTAPKSVSPLLTSDFIVDAKAGDVLQSVVVNGGAVSVDTLSRSEPAKTDDAAALVTFTDFDLKRDVELRSLTDPVVLNPAGQAAAAVSDNRRAVTVRSGNGAEPDEEFGYAGQPVVLRSSDLAEPESGDGDTDGLSDLYQFRFQANESGLSLSRGQSAPALLHDGEDFDGDGLTNGDEEAFGTDPRVPDSDDDGVSSLSGYSAHANRAGAVRNYSWDTGAYGRQPGDERRVWRSENGRMPQRQTRLQRLPPDGRLFVKAQQAYRNGKLDESKALLKQLAVEYPEGKAAANGRELVEALHDLEESDEEEAYEQGEAEGEEELPPAPRRPPPPVNPFVLTAKDRQSTFALEADTASYTMSRRYIRKGYRPPPAVVRMEEFVNAFDYNYPRQSQRVFTVHAQASSAPFGRDLTLLKIGVKGKVLGRDGRRASHLVYVIDASGSMGREDRLPLVKYALSLLLDQLDARDRVTLVTYDTRARLHLEAVSAREKGRIRAAIQAIDTGASTNLLGGIELGYQMAARHYRSGDINRVILCSDGVANVGPSDASSLLEKVDRYRRQGVTFTSVGVGSGSYDDHMLEQLANKGDGNYVYIDTRAEARRVFLDEMSATLQTIAKDVKIQVEFNPKRVRRYRLIGYENRDIADKDFRNDKVDAGEIGSGQSATALYELELHDSALEQIPDLGTIAIRFKHIDDGRVEEFSTRLADSIRYERTPASDPRFFLAACAAEFAELLRGSEHARGGGLEALEQVMIRAANALPLDEQVQGLLSLVQKAQGLPVAQ